MNAAFVNIDTQIYFFYVFRKGGKRNEIKNQTPLAFGYVGHSYYQHADFDHDGRSDCDRRGESRR